MTEKQAKVKCSGCRRFFEFNGYKLCESCLERNRKYQKAHRKEAREYSHEYRKIHQNEGREKKRTYGHQYYIDNKEKINERNRRYYEVNKARFSAESYQKQGLCTICKKPLQQVEYKPDGKPYVTHKLCRDQKNAEGRAYYLKPENKERRNKMARELAALPENREKKRQRRYLYDLERGRIKPERIFRPLTDVERGYISGVIDARASFLAKKQSAEGIRGFFPRLQITFNTKHKNLLEYINQIIEGDAKIRVLSTSKQPQAATVQHDGKTRNICFKNPTYTVNFTTKVCARILPQLSLYRRKDELEILLALIFVYENRPRNRGRHYKFDPQYELAFDKLVGNWETLKIVKEEKRKTQEILLSRGRSRVKGYITNPVKLGEFERGYIAGYLDARGRLKVEQHPVENDIGYNLSIGVEFYSDQPEHLKQIQKLMLQDQKPIHYTNRGFDCVAVGNKKSSKWSKRSCVLSYGRSVCRWLLPQLPLFRHAEQKDVILRLIELIESKPRMSRFSYDAEYITKMERLIDEFYGD